MSVEAVRRVSRSGGAIVRPQAISDKSYVESVVSFLHEVVPQAVTGTQRQEDKEKVLWVKFEQGDINDVALHQEEVRNGSPLPLLLILGYTNGFQIWIVPPSGEAQELVSLRQGPVRLVQMLKTPHSVGPSVVKDEFAGSRPLFAICDAASPSVPFSTVNLWSLSTGEQVHSVGFKSEVYDVLSNKRLMVVALQEKIAAFDACTMKSQFCVMSCYPAPSPNLNPLALGTTWLAFADQKLVPNHQSCGGISGDHIQSYTATVISAAKTLSRGLTMFGETVGRLTGSHSTESLNEFSAPTNQKSGKVVPVPGVVTVMDTSRSGNGEFCVQEDDHEGAGIIAHFLASAGEPISALAFDISESLLVTADSLGHNFHVFRLMPHPVCSSLGSVHHLYTLHRGNTTATVHSISFSLDTRWVAVSTLRGTTHVFPITTYGGPVTVRTHTSLRVVNRSSRFHTSAGLDDIDHARSTRNNTGNNQNSSGSPNGSPLGVSTTMLKDNFTLGGGGSNGLMNPRLPPLPHPTVVYPLAQIKTPINTRCSGSCCGGTGSSSVKCSGKLMPEALGNVVEFAASRGWLASSPTPARAEPSRAMAVESLFILDLHGNLTEYVLEPQGTRGVPQSEETPLELQVTSRAQWALARSPTLPEHKLPLSKGHPILRTNFKEAHQSSDYTSTTKRGMMKVKVNSTDPECPTSELISLGMSNHSNSKETNDQWLSNIEMESHASPHRRLWMGPQFAFKTFQPPGSLSSPSQGLGDTRTGCGATITPNRDGYPMDFYAEELDLQSLRLQPVRSDPLPTPGLRGAFTGYVSTNLGETMPLVAVDNGPGSLNDPYGSWPGVCNGALDDKEDHLVETLAEAMNENATAPVKREKLARSCSESSQGDPQFEFQSDSAGGCISAFASCSPSQSSPFFPPGGSPEWN